MRSLAIVTFALALYFPGQVAAQQAVVGQTAPDFTLTDETGAAHTLSEYRGKTVVLEWINPQCPYVQRHYAANTMENLATRFAEHGVVWLSVNSSHFITAEAAAEFKAAEGFSYPTLLDASGDVGRTYGARTTPHMYVIDSAGTLVYAGGIDDDPRGQSEAPTNYVDLVLSAVTAGSASPISASEPYGCTVKYE